MFHILNTHKMQIKTTLRFHFAPVRMAKTENRTKPNKPPNKQILHKLNTTNASVSMGKGECKLVKTLQKPVSDSSNSLI